MDTVQDLLKDGWEFLRVCPPGWLIAAMAFLPLVGAPICPLWIMAGIRLGPLAGFLGAFGALILNDALAYWLGTRWLREWIQHVISRRGYQVPQFGATDGIRLIMFCRLTPGFPLCLQNYLLGCLKVAFKPYLLLSILLQAGWVFGFVVFGDALTHTTSFKLALAISALIAMAILIRLIRRRWGVTRPEQRRTEV